MKTADIAGMKMIQLTNYYDGSARWIPVYRIVELVPYQDAVFVRLDSSTDGRLGGFQVKESLEEILNITTEGVAQ